MGEAFLYGNNWSESSSKIVTVHVFYRSSVNITCTNGKKTYTGITDANYNAIFKLLKGIWTITAEKDGYTSSINVNVSEDCTVNMSIFSATINVTYPAGSTCTATDGVTNLTAPDTSGVWDCVVPNAGTWTITAANGTFTATQSVSITSSGQTVSVSLSYTLMIYDRGTINSSIGMTTDGYTYGGNNAKDVTFGSSSIIIASSDSIAGTTNAVDVTNYSTLRVTMKSGASNTEHPWCALCKTKETTGSNLVSRTPAGSTDETTRRIDVSSLSGSYYILVAVSSSSTSGTIYDIYLDP